MDLALIWFGIIAFGIAIYVLLDGFDLGIGILFPFARQDVDRDVMMNSVAPVWDGNETWLILGGAGLLAAFPKAYATLLSALYIPVFLMLTALIFRGVAFEFRFKARRSRFLWDISFAGGSMLAAFFQGVTLGAVVEGLSMSGGEYTGGAWGWLSGFALITGAGLMGGYALLGATWLVMKTDGELQQWSFRIARRVLLVVLVFIAVISLWTPWTQEAIRERWFSLPNFYYLSQVPLLTFLLAAGCWYMLKRQRRERLPFVFSIGLFLLSYSGLLISLWPYIVPRAITFREAAAPDSTLAFTLVGVAILMPFVLFYTAVGYRVFRGKVDESTGYH